MAEPITDKLKNAMKTTEDLYYRLVLLVGKAGSGKSNVLRDVAEEFGTSIINVNLELSSELLELTTRQRSLKLPEILDQITDKAQSPVILDNLEVLFDMGLRQDPLRLLERISRNRTVVASWNGQIVAQRLLYAQMGHPEYRAYDSFDALTVEMEE